MGSRDLIGTSVGFGNAFPANLTLKRVGGGEITRIQLRSIKTIAKFFFTDFRMDSKFELVRRVLPQKIWGSSDQRLIFGGPKKSEVPYFQIANLSETEEIYDFHSSEPNFLRAVKPKRWGPQTYFFFVSCFLVFLVDP